jgi:hypothetical protein
VCANTGSCWFATQKMPSSAVVARYASSSGLKATFSPSRDGVRRRSSRQASSAAAASSGSSTHIALGIAL